MKYRMVVLAALVFIAPIAESQEKPRTRLAVFAGGSVLYGSGNPWFSPNNQFNLTSADTVVTTSGMDNIGHLGLGVSRPLGNTAIVLRGDLLLNVNGDRPPEPAPYPSFMNVRQALRENTLLASGGLQWDALPWHRFSPYMLTSVGIRRSWISWSRDSLSTCGHVLQPYFAGVCSPWWASIHSRARSSFVQPPRAKEWVASLSTLTMPLTRHSKLPSGAMPLTTRSRKVSVCANDASMARASSMLVAQSTSSA